jgi:hypothetical protein
MMTKYRKNNLEKIIITKEKFSKEYNIEKPVFENKKEGVR